MSARSKARKRALDILFESEQRGIDAVELLGQRLTAAAPPVNEHTVSLVQGVAEHRARIDEILTTYAEGWSLERMPAVDRNLLRIGSFELLWAQDVPDAVAINEAVTLAHELSTDESPRFVNGLLGRILSLKASLIA
jgi:N utilization substance protein B